MPSRKKAQGKARKAAKAEAARKIEAYEQACEVQLQRLRLEDDNSCVHGCDKPDHITCDFMKEYLSVVATRRMVGSQCPYWVAFDVAAEKYPQMEADHSNTGNIESLLVALGTNCVLSGEIFLARKCAASAHYFRRMSAIYREMSRCNRGEVSGVRADLEMEKIMELYVSDEHTLVRYLQKRIPCSCLDAKYQEVKGIKKIGLCGNPKCKIPDRVAERSTMLYCTKCRKSNYCSRECQEADWPLHKEKCGGYWSRDQLDEIVMKSREGHQMEELFAKAKKGKK